MDSLTIVNKARQRTETNIVDYDNVVAIEDLNIIYNEVIDEIVVISKGDYFWDIGTTDLVEEQNEYLAEKLGIAPDDLDIRKINKVFVKYGANDKFIKARYQNPGVLTEHPSYYQTNQPKSDPFFYIQDNSIFLYPVPKAGEGNVTGGLELFVIHSPADLDINSTEDDIEIPKAFHKLLILGLMKEIYYSQAKFNEAQVIEAKYKEGIRDMVTFMKQRYNQPIKKQIIVPNQFK